MDKSQVRSCINETFPVGYDPLTGNIFIDTTGASLGDTLVNTSSGVVWQPASGVGATWGSITGTLSSQTDLQSALDALVPYTGATNDVDLDTFSLNAKSLHVKGTGGAGHLGLKHQSANATANANETAIFADSNGDLKTKNDALYYSTFKTSLNTADRTYTFPDASGTLALTNQLPTPAALTKVDDTNVTLTLGGTPATALLQATSLTLGWSGQLSIARGGTGLGTLGTANQLLRVNAGATALEYFTPTFLTGLTVGTTPIASGTVGRILFEGAGNVLQENAILNLDTTNGLIIGGATTRATRLTVVNSANTNATKIFTQRNAADSSDYTTLRGDGSIDFNNNGSTTNTYLTVGNNTYNFATTYGSLVSCNVTFGTANVWNVTGGSISFSSMYGCNNQIAATSGTRQHNHMLGYNLVATNSSYTSILGNFISMNGALRSNVIGSKVSGGLLLVSTTDSTILGTCNAGNTLFYTNSLTTYFNSANASHWLHGNGNIGLFGKLYDILQDNAGGVANRLTTYMDINATNTLTIHNGTAPAVTIANAVQVYAADQTAGNSALFVRTENNDIVKIYSIGGWGTPTGTLTRTTFATYGGATAGVLYDQTIMQDLIDAVKINSERLAALISDLKTGQQLLKA